MVVNMFVFVLHISRIMMCSVSWTCVLCLWMCVCVCLCVCVCVCVFEGGGNCCVLNFDEQFWLATRIACYDVMVTLNNVVVMFCTRDF